MLMLLFCLQAAIAQDKSAQYLRYIQKKFLPPPRIEQEVSGDHPFVELRPPPPGLTEILQSPVVQKAIRHKGQLQNLKTEEMEFMLERKIINVHSLADDAGYLYVINRRGEISHRVHTRFTDDVREIVTMYEAPKSYAPVEAKERFSPVDTPLAWSPEISFLVGRASSSWTADLLDDPAAKESVGYQLGGHLIADFKKRFQLGGIFKLEGTQYDLQNGNASYRNYNFGLLARTPVFDWGGFNWRVRGEVLYGPFSSLRYTINGQVETVNLRTTSTVIGWEKLAQNSLGDWSWGVSWQRDWPKIRNQQEYVELEAAAHANDIVGVNFTQGFTW